MSGIFDGATKLATKVISDSWICSRKPQATDNDHGSNEAADAEDKRKDQIRVH
ncbi:hypothetical protein MMG85_18070 [Pseudoxanthomonas sp. LH2527]|uniref:hypothetical protein n=1 Tax=Pseudoxanthomonas sp. LH2527 TaxID=2923249 RepID=UPI001F13BBEA|nr:hypothetical protein [Pseudoxanthomonas sp. LH2527]MCH6485461.1 hypothetical protein [Pseudoxanthomonas sp. LH2527]